MLGAIDRWLVCCPYEIYSFGGCFAWKARVTLGAVVSCGVALKGLFVNKFLSVFCVCLWLAGMTGCSTVLDPASDSASTSDFAISSIAVASGELLESYACEQKVNNIEASIPLAWENVPEGTGSLAITMTHYPEGETVTPNAYLLLWDIDLSVTGIDHGEAGNGSWYMGSNKDGNAVSYTSPCSQSPGSHDYTITIYALDMTPASLPSESTVNVTYRILKDAIDTVSVIASATMAFSYVTTGN